MKRTRNITKSGRRPGAPAFTLAELLVVTGVIVLAMGIVVPSLHGLFNARTDREAEGVFAAMLTLARGTAIEKQTYALLHGGTGDDGAYWVGVFSQDPASGKFVPAAGTTPKQIAGHMGFGEVSTRYVSGSSYLGSIDDDWENFGALNVIFASDGSLTTTVDGLPPQFDPTHAVFTGASRVKVWDVGTATLNETGVRAVTVYEHKLLKLRTARQAYLQASGRFIVINPYTGQLIEDEVE